MINPKIIAAIADNQWAITTPAFRAILAAVEREPLDDKQASYLHSMPEDTKIDMVASFGEPYPDSRYAYQLGNVGFITTYGPTIPRADFFSRASGVASYDGLIKDFKALEADARIDTIALMNDSPGGAVTGTSDWADTIKASSKRVVAYSWMSASANYWAASAASEIYAPATGVVGSIGAIVSLPPDTAKADEKKGIRQRTIISSQTPKKNAIDTPEGMEAIQDLVNGTADIFIDNVAVNRNTTRENVLNNFGQGAMVLANKALEAGMIDGIMGVNDFVTMLVDSKDTSIFYLQSAQADITAEGNDMAKETVSNEAPLTAAQLKQAYPSAVLEIEQAAIATEHERLKSVEAMCSQYASNSPQVREAARGVIDTRKFDTNATVGTLGPDVFAAANAAMQNQLKNFGEQHTKGTEAAEHTATAKPDVLPKDPKQLGSEKVVAGLAAHMGGN